MVAACSVTFAVNQTAPPEQDLYQAWEWVHLYHTQIQNNPYSEPSPVSPWRKDWRVIDDCSNNSAHPMVGGGFATRFYSNITSDGVVHMCDNWFDIESVTVYICPPTSMCSNEWWQFELRYANSDANHSIGGLVQYPEGGGPVIDPFLITPGNVWYTRQVPHFDEGLPTERPLFMQDTSFWVVVKPIGPDYPSGTEYMWHDPTGVWFTPPPSDPNPQLLDGRYVYDGANPEGFVFEDGLPGGYTINAAHGVPIMAALISKHSYYPRITQPPPDGSIPVNEAHAVTADIHTLSGYAGNWENQDYGPVHFWITTLDGGTTVYDQTINPFFFPNPATLVATFPDWTPTVPGDYWMNCYNAFPYDWVTTTPAAKLHRKQINVHALDVGVNTIEQPTGIYNAGNLVIPRVRVQNMGSVPASFDVRFWVPNASYDGTRQITDLAPGEELEVKFEEMALSYAGRYEGHCKVLYGGDQNPANDELVSPFEVTSTSTPVAIGKPVVRAKGNVTSGTIAPRTAVALATNPVSRVARITVPGNVPITVNLYTAYGRLVKTFNTNECDVSKLANGIYLMKVTAYSKTKTLRLLVEH